MFVPVRVLSSLCFGGAGFGAGDRFFRTVGNGRWKVECSAQNFSTILFRMESERRRRRRVRVVCDPGSRMSYM